MENDKHNLPMTGGLIQRLAQSLNRYSTSIAFTIGEEHYTYSDLRNAIGSIQDYLHHQDAPFHVVGVVTNDDLRTYASILALWFEHKIVVPISKQNPPHRCRTILEQSKVELLLDSSQELFLADIRSIQTTLIPLEDKNVKVLESQPDQVASILFTSGSTGIPKGVSLTFANMEGFVESYCRMDPAVDPSDKFLQLYDLTFDASVMSYVIPLLFGGRVVTVPNDEERLMHILDRLDAGLAEKFFILPSVMRYLLPFLPQINLEQVKLIMVGGEAVPMDLMEKWVPHFPHTRFINIYGPTECTIFSCCYSYFPDQTNKSNNGILSIGKPINQNIILLLDEKLNKVQPGERGVLYIGGNQVSPGYWNNMEATKNSFFTFDIQGSTTPFYCTGDICFEDQDGDYHFLSRVDNQVKINGFRVELLEVEHVIKQVTGLTHLVAIPYTNALGDPSLGLVLEGDEFKLKEILITLNQRLPNYMIPSKVIYLERIPINQNGKINRIALKELFT